MESEIWKSIPGYLHYEVSNLGRIRSSKKASILGLHILKPRSDKDGYLRITLYQNSKKVDLYVHVLVLTTFAGPKPKDFQCAHNNGISSDNNINNLRWVSQIENEADKVRHGTANIGMKNPSRKLTESDVLYIRDNYKNTGGCRTNVIELANKFGVNRFTIFEAATRRTWKHI